MTTKTNEKLTAQIIEVLELDELEFIQHIQNQLQDNLEEFQRLNKEGMQTGNTEELWKVSFEIERLSKRHESLFNLLSRLNTQVDEKVSKAIDLVQSIDNNDFKG